MTIDERLEALAQTVERMAGMQRASEERMAEREKRTAEREERMAERDERMATRMGQIMEAVNSLARLAGVHQDRLEDHGKRLEDLEQQ